MNKWLNTNVTLKCWLVFLFVFTVAGYRVEVAIALGALGGLSGGFIASWWNAKGSEDIAQPDAEKVVNFVRRFKRRVEGQLGLTSDQQKGRAKSPKMGFFKVRDPYRGSHRRYRGAGLQDEVPDDSTQEDQTS
ncbi:MAG: hypothetical protein VKL39_01800 [Leptolyngbyaceae bacterium]|nr:hypothetical protein [Leptolyngbyaceae bacterium]